MHVLPLQQPVGHDVASHTHWPLPLHSWPDAQAPHATPPVPHDPLDSPANSSHVPDAVQHPGHDVPAQEHAPLAQDSPVPQAEQALPPVPHWVADCVASGTHVVPSQQPVGHDVASHTHWPIVLLHSWPAAHVPHATPAAPHESFDCEP